MLGISWSNASTGTRSEIQKHKPQNPPKTKQNNKPAPAPKPKPPPKPPWVK
jgi:hypothetical protein